MGTAQMLLRIVADARDGRYTRISDLAREEGITRKECIHLLGILKEQLDGMGYALIPGSVPRVCTATGVSLPTDSVNLSYTHVLSSFAKACFVYLAKIRLEPAAEPEYASVRLETGVPHDELTGNALLKYAVPVIYCFIILNSCDIEWNELIRLIKTGGIGESVLQDAIQQHYFKQYKKEDGCWIRPGWRFFFDYPDFSLQQFIDSFHSRTSVITSQEIEHQDTVSGTDTINTTVC